jgi:predicted transcriptional regulator
MYSSANTIFNLRHKALRKEKELPPTIDQPHLVIFGTAIPSHFYDSLSEKFLTNGLLARMVVLEAGRRGKGQSPPPKNTPTKILATAKWWATFNPAAGNLSQVHPGPRTVQSTDEAKTLMADGRAEVEEYYGASEDAGDSVGAAIWGRVIEHARKLALIYAVSENPQQPLIGKEAVTWAHRFAIHQARRMLFMTQAYVSSNPFDAAGLKILRILRATKTGAMTHTTLLNAMKIDTDVLQRIIKTLEQRGNLETVTEKTRGRDRKVYRAIGKGVMARKAANPTERGIRKNAGEEVEEAK